LIEQDRPQEASHGFVLQKERQMAKRSMYIWKLWEVVQAEGSPERIIAKAQQASISTLWVKVADGTSPFRNVGDEVRPDFEDLIAGAHRNDIEIWGWQVPHCDTVTIAKKEAKVFGDLVEKFGLDGLIMDAEGTSAYFHGDLAEAKAYGAVMRDVADNLRKPLGISSNDIPQNIDGWTPKFTEIAKKADFNFPQTYYGASPSVTNRLERAVAGNANLTIPFIPVGASFLGTDEGGCSTASACAERAREFVRLCNERNYQGYSFWHWGGAPMSLWLVLNTTPA
jgi:hypothetical protein